MYVINIHRHLRWLAAAAVALVAVLLLTSRYALPAAIEEHEDAAPVNASVGLRTASQSGAAPALQSGLRPIYSAQTTEKVVALTFDISWGKAMPPKVLEVLRQEQVKATFFLSGPWSSKNEATVKAIQAGGHEIESHGQAHVDLNTLGRERAAKNISDAHEILTGITGRAPAYIRPPNGAYDKTSVQAAKDVGYDTVIWSVDSLDWKNPGVDTIIRRVSKMVHPGAVILMHASDSCKQTDQALPVVIKNLRQQGYTFMLLDDLVKKYGVDGNGFIHTMK